MIVGAGAAGLACAIFAARGNPQLRVVLLDGAARLGAKILVSGGGRCNVTNVRVSAEDYWGGSRNTIKRVLAGFTVAQTIAWFESLGVPLYEDYDGKLFPKSDSAKSVVGALLNEAQQAGVDVRPGHRVTGIQPQESAFRVISNESEIKAQRVVLATGGRSLPKTGSDGAGYGLASALGHSLVPQTPALAPLVLEGAFHTGLAGVSHEAGLTFRIAGERPIVLRGSLLWTHFGLSGPLPMNASRIWHRARLERREMQSTLSFQPGESVESMEQRLIAAGAAQPKSTLRNILAEWVPQRVADALLEASQLPARVALSHLTREDRRRAARAICEFPILIRDSRGYGHAEATAGGVPLSEIDPTTMASRVCKGLYLVGEILDCDGRIGGFNFQWAWATGRAAGCALARPPAVCGEDQ